MERETGIEPATNSLEGCDSTTELLPPSRLAPLRPPRRYGGQARLATRSLTCRLALVACHERAMWERAALPHCESNGQGRVRTSVARWAADLQSAAIDHSATCP